MSATEPEIDPDSLPDPDGTNQLPVPREFTDLQEAGE